MLKNISDQMSEIIDEKNAQSLVCQYLSEQPNLKGISATDITKKCYVSNATVTRLAQRLGFNGYSDFAAHLDIEKKKVLKANKTLHLLPEYIIENTLETLTSSFNNIDEDQIDQIIDLMYESKKIIGFALGGTAITIQDFILKLRRLNLNAYTNSDYHVQFVEAQNTDQKTLVFVVSYSGDKKELLHLMEISKNNQAKVVLVTGNEQVDPKYYDFLLLVDAPEYVKRDYSIMSTVSMLSFLNYLYLKYLSLYSQEMIHILDNTKFKYLK